MKLTHFKLCPFSRATRLILAELDLPFEADHATPWALPPAFLASNPAGRLPVLQLADGTQLSGFYALSEFIGDAQTQGFDLAQTLTDKSDPDRPTGPQPHLFPGDIEDRAEVRRLVDWFHQKCDREVTQEFLYERVRAMMDRSQAQSPNASVLRAARINLRYHLDYVGFLADQRNWLAGDRISAADFVAAAHLSVIDYLDEITWDAYPFVQAWYQKVKSRRSFRPLLEDRVPGVAPPAHYALLDF